MRRVHPRRRPQRPSTCGSRSPCGFYSDGRPAEVFVDIANSGADIAGIARDAGVLLSLALQHGVAAGTVGMRRHGARAMSARRRAPTLYALAAEELERAGGAKAVTALTHRLLADETLRQALVEPIIRNIAAGLIATVVHHRRGAE